MGQGSAAGAACSYFDALSFFPRLWMVEPSILKNEMAG